MEINCRFLVQLVFPDDGKSNSALRKKSMAFGSTITITINAVAKVLPRINQDNYGSVYKLFETTGTITLKIRHSTETPKNGRPIDRHNLEVTQEVYAVPGSPGTPAYTRQAYIVMRNNPDDVLATIGFLDAALAAYWASGTVIADLNTWQS